MDSVDKALDCKVRTNKLASVYGWFVDTTYVIGGYHCLQPPIQVAKLVLALNFIRPLMIGTQLQCIVLNSTTGRKLDVKALVLLKFWRGYLRPNSHL